MAVCSLSKYDVKDEHMKHLILGLLIAVLSGSVFAKSVPKGGDEFRETAQEFALKSDEARAAGDFEKSKIYAKLSAIKEEAAQLADKGRWSDIDWTEYNTLNAKLSDGKAVK